jgi:hypothetical protein
MNDNNTVERNELNNITQLISNLSALNQHSTNIILQGIAQGISNGIAQGIASGNIALSFQDIISLATVFKPSNELSFAALRKLTHSCVANTIDIKSSSVSCGSSDGNTNLHVSSVDSNKLLSTSMCHEMVTPSETSPSSTCGSVAENVQDFMSSYNIDKDVVSSKDRKRLSQREHLDGDPTQQNGKKQKNYHSSHPHTIDDDLDKLEEYVTALGRTCNQGIDFVDKELSEMTGKSSLTIINFDICNKSIISLTRYFVCNRC